MPLKTQSRENTYNMATSMDPSGLLKRAKAGESLRREELEWIRGELNQQQGRQDPYTLLHILWRSKDLDSVTLFEQALLSSDEMVRRIGVQALGDLVPNEDTFLLTSRLFRRDPSVYVRAAAATAIGDIGARTPALRSRAATILLDVFNSHETARDYDWEASYEGLLNLLRVAPRDRPPSSRPLQPDDVRADVLAKARTAAATPI